MKFKIMIICLLLFNQLAVFAENLNEAENNTMEYEPPYWNEFCQGGWYCSAEYTSVPNYPKFSDYILAFSVVGVPYVLGRKNKQERAIEQNYWVNRREQFFQELSNCEDVKNKDNRYGCYLSLRAYEHSKNAERMARIADQNARMAKGQAMYHQLQLNQLRSQVNTNQTIQQPYQSNWNY